MTPYAGKLVRLYYLVTPLFVILDAWFGVSLRASGLTETGYRYPYYAFCLLCAAGCYWRPRHTALIAMAESSVNLLILLLGILVPVMELGNLPADPDAVALISGEKVLNFLISGFVLVSVFHAAQYGLHEMIRGEE